VVSWELDKTSFDCSNAGSNTVTLTVKDAAGNSNTATAVVTVVDAINPVAITQPVTINLGSGGTASVTPAQINSGSTDNCTIASYSLDITSFDCSNVGANTVILTVTDVNGNSSTANAVVTVEDKVAPVITCKSSTSKFVDPFAIYYTVSGTEFDANATDACGIKTLNYALTGVTTGSGTTLSGVQLNLGVNTIKWTAVDNNNNISECTTVITVEKRTTTLTYTGTTSINYYGVASLSATLKDVLNANVAGKTITFTIGTQSTTAVTNASGVASTTLQIIQIPGSYTVSTVFVTDASYVGSSDSDSFIINKAATALTLTLSGYQVRYMDNLTYTAVVKPENNGNALTGSVIFNVMQGSTVITSYTANVVPIPGSLDGSVQAMVINQLPATVIPGSYTVTAIFTSTNTNYSNSNTDSKTLKVDPRDASPYLSTGMYTGDLFAWTTGPSTSTATVTLVAALKDASAPTGDLRSAKVTFYLVNGTTYTPIASAQNLPVGLVDVTDGSVGTASAIVQLNIGSANAASFQIAVGVSGAYTNNPGDIKSLAIVTVSKPVAGGYIVGGGQVANSNSSGYIKGAPEVNTGYEFDIQYTKSGTNPKGKVNIILGSYYKTDGTLDSKLHTYIITTNAIALLNVTAPTGTFDAKANLVEQIGDGVTVPFSTVAIEGGSTFQMKAYQNTCDQQIAITLYRKAGGVWFSSNWSATTASTALKTVTSASNVYVSGGGTCTGSVSATKLVSSSLNNTSIAGEMVTFKATVSGTGTPTGTIAFKEGTTILATVNLVGGIASYSTSTLTVGSHQIVASYSGDLKSKASDSSIVTQTVNAAPTARTSAPVIAKQVKAIPVIEETIPFNVIAYPNPAKYQFTLEVQGGSKEKVDVVLYDVLGRTVKHIESNDGQPIQFGEELPTGAYFTIVSQGANQKTVRLIKE
jgi:hypothetical protein